MIDQHELVRRYVAEESIRDLAREAGVAYGTVRSRLVAANVTLRPRGRMAFSPRRSLSEPSHLRLPGPRAARRAQGGRGPDNLSRGGTEVDDQLVELVRAGVTERLAKRALWDAVDEVPEQDWAQLGHVLHDALAPEVLVADTGSTGGVRRNPTTGEIERF